MDRICAFDHVIVGDHVAVIGDQETRAHAAALHGRLFFQLQFRRVFWLQSSQQFFEVLIINLRATSHTASRRDLHNGAGTLLNEIGEIREPRCALPLGRQENRCTQAGCEDYFLHYCRAD